MSNSRPVTSDLPTTEEAVHEVVAVHADETKNETPALSVIAEEHEDLSENDQPEPTPDAQTKKEETASNAPNPNPAPNNSPLANQFTAPARSPKAKLPPFQELELTLKTLSLVGKDGREPRLSKAIFFDNLLKAIEANKEDPENAVKVVKQMVEAKQDEHPEISDMLAGNFYRDISCLRHLKKETILTEYEAYINAIKENPPTCDFHVYLRNRLLLDQGNVFAKLHAYLQENESTEAAGHEYNYKLSKFASALIVKLPVVPKQGGNEDPDFAASGTIEGDAKYLNEMQASLKEYSEKKGGFFGTVLRMQKHSGKFKDIIFDALFKQGANLNNICHQHKAYLDFLDQVPENVSHFADLVKAEVKTIRQKTGADFTERAGLKKQ